MKELRDFITAIDNASSAQPIEIMETYVEEAQPLSDRLGDLVFKLRSHSEPMNESYVGDYSLGVEAGCEMAAEMIENLIRQLDND